MAQEENITDSPAPDRKDAMKNGHSSSESVKPIDLDYVLTHELGQFGRFQLKNFALVAIPLMMSAFMSEFIFSAAAIPHRMLSDFKSFLLAGVVDFVVILLYAFRCRIPECGEYGKRHKFEPEWVLNAIPATATGFHSTQRFAPRDVYINGSLEYCPEELFDRSVTISCDGFVYAWFNTVVYDFDLGGQDWLRALSGTLNSIGTLLVLPITGYISDRFGRRIALVLSVFNLAAVGLIRAFSVNYPMYMALQLLQTTLGAGTFSSAYIFAAELVGPKYRVLTSATSTSMFALGQVILGGVAWLIEPWRYMIMALKIPCFLIISYYWLLSESVRWLLAKQKFDRAKKLLEKVAKTNRKEISDKSMEALLTPPPESSSKEERPNLARLIIRSPILLRRVCTTPIWWITATFVYYGITINSVGLSDRMHLNYILTCAIEIPGFYTAVLVLDRIGRKATLCIAYFFSAACNIAFVFIPKEYFTVRLIVFLLGKFGISTVMTSVYLFTSELYPTEYRHSLLAFSSMVGRLGSITAPLTPVLMQYWHGIPSMMFSGMGILSGILVLTQPETLGTRMPDTLAEAEALGTPESKVQKST